MLTPFIHSWTTCQRSCTGVVFMGPKGAVSDTHDSGPQRALLRGGCWLVEACDQTSPPTWAHEQWVCAGQKFESDSTGVHHDAKTWERQRGRERGNCGGKPGRGLCTTPAPCMSTPYGCALPPDQPGRVPKRTEPRPGRTEGVLTTGKREKSSSVH